MHTVKIAENTRRKAQSAFTLIELLVVIIIIVMLMSLVYSVIMRTKTRHKEMQFDAELKSLFMALNGYRNTYGSWPGQGGKQNDGCYITNNGVIIDILTGNPDSVRYNPRQIPFFKDIQSSWTNNDHTYVDSWGKPFMIAFDNDNDGKIQDPAQRQIRFPCGGQDTWYVKFDASFRKPGDAEVFGIKSANLPQSFTIDQVQDCERGSKDK